ncbi:MAG: hypothetical protein WBV88_03315, partial [Candidatus Rickettsiella isopodorum]
QKFWEKMYVECEQFKSEIITELKSKMEQNRIDIQNKMKAEFELKRAQDKAECETSRAQDRAEFKQSNAKMEERIEKIMNDLLRLQQPSTLDHSMPSNNPGFFNSR